VLPLEELEDDDALLELDEDDVLAPDVPVLPRPVPVDVPELLELDEDDPEHPDASSATAIPTIKPRIHASKGVDC
jgi:hypothetical protein